MKCYVENYIKSHIKVDILHNNQDATFLHQNCCH
ncbi:hypothetical protein G6M89_16825 [Natronolimnobius sp. AArcel1]|nr:hypothetical protein [Natronolimnobius sp. AArcel1]